MRFAQVEPPSGHEGFERLYRHWESRGWRRVPKAEEPGIKGEWDRLLPRGVHSIRAPWITWDVYLLRAMSATEHDQAETDLTLKTFSAFRRCVRKGEHLLALDPLHAWYYFNPMAEITTATRDDWAMPVLPDGDFNNFFASDFRFGVIGDCRMETITAFGKQFLDELATVKPGVLTRVVARDGVPVTWMSARAVRKQSRRVADVRHMIGAMARRFGFLSSN